MVPQKKFYILTFGCQMNVRDSQWLAAAMKARGHMESSLEEAEIIFINTCSVREKPEQKIYSVLRAIGQINKKEVLIAALGCVAQQLGGKLFDADARVRLVAGGDSIAQVPDAIATLAKSSKSRMELLGFSPEYAEREYDPACLQSAFVNIMQGCDNFCAYCIVPFTRGRQRSRRAEAVLRECWQRVREGSIEITLLGQNVNAWGQDNGESIDFTRLLEKAAALPGLARLRYVSAHPRDMDRFAIEAFGYLENLCPRLHLPLQAGSDNVLKKMKRGYSAADFRRIAEGLYKARPDLALSTDLIVGFPGETEEDFQQTLNLVRECGFVASYSFCYSDRPGTRAEKMPDKIADEIKHERLLRLQELQDELSARWLAGRVGQKTGVLLESPSPRQLPGRNFWQGRDPYGAAVNVDLGAAEMRGLVDVEIIESKKHSLVGKLLP